MNIKENSSSKLLIVDGNGLAYRAFYALPTRNAALGFPVNAVLGFIHLLLNAIISEKPTHIAVAFDHGALVDSLMKFQTYNVQREEMLDELAMQLPIIEDFIHICGIHSFRLPGFEADDCIGTLSAQANRDGMETIIISGDLDLMQLVAPHIRVMTMRRGIADSVIFDEDMVLKKYGLRPRQLADLRALAGDSSQNIGGVPGIGEVTARRLLSQYNSLMELFDSLDQLPAKWRNPLSENRDDAFEFLSRSTIRCDLPLEINWEKCRFNGFPIELVKRIFGQLHLEGLNNFVKIMAQIPAQEEPSGIPEEPLYGDAARQALEAMRCSREDIAVVWLHDREKKETWGISLCLKGSHPIYLDLSSWHGVVPLPPSPEPKTEHTQASQDSAERKPETAKTHKTVRKSTGRRSKKAVPEAASSEAPTLKASKATVQAIENSQISIDSQDTNSSSNLRRKKANEPSVPEVTDLSDTQNSGEQQNTQVEQDKPEFNLQAWTQAHQAPTPEEVWKVLAEIFADKERVKYVIDIHELSEQKIAIANVRSIVLMSSLIDLNLWDHSIEAICARYGFAIYDHKLVMGPKKGSLGTVPLSSRICWTSRAADVLPNLGERLYARLQKMELVESYNKIELPLNRFSWRMNNNSIRCDPTLVQNVVNFIDAKMKELRDDFFQEAEVPEFDLDSEEALSDYLFNHLSLLVPTRPKNGSILSAEMLKSLQEQNAIVFKIRRYCELSEFRRTFVQKFMLEGSLHVEVGEHLFNLALLSERLLQFMGRVSCQGAVEVLEHMIAISSNLACTEVRRPLVKVLDNFLRPTGVHRLIYLRLTSFSLRVLAYLANDKKLTADLEAGKNIEQELLQATFEERTEQLILPHSLITHMLFFYFSPAWLARRLDLEGEEGISQATQYLQKFESVLSGKYPTSWEFFLRNQARATAMEDSVTLAGRRCRFVEAGSRNYSIREAGERAARAFAVEGTCADVLRLTLVKMYENFAEDVYAIPCNGMLIVSAPNGQEQEIARRSHELLMQAAGDIPIKVECYIH